MSRLPRIVALLVTVILLAATPRLFAVAPTPPVQKPIDVINPNVVNSAPENPQAEPPIDVPTLVADPSDVAAFEGQDLVFTVRLVPADAARETAIVFDWVVPPDEADGAQEGSDYEVSRGRGTIGPGQDAGTFSIPTLVNDRASEPRSLRVYVSLGSEQSTTLTGTIFDRPAITVQAGTPATEGERLLFQVGLDRAAALPITYRWQVTEGAEWLAVDQLPGGDRTIESGQTGDTIGLTTREDDVENGQRYVTVTVSADGFTPAVARGEIRSLVSVGPGPESTTTTTTTPWGPIHYIVAILTVMVVSFVGWKVYEWLRPDTVEDHDEPAAPVVPTAVARAGAATVAPIGVRPAAPPIELFAVAGTARIGSTHAVLVEEGVDDG